MANPPLRVKRLDSPLAHVGATATDEPPPEEKLPMSPAKPPLEAEANGEERAVAEAVPPAKRTRAISDRASVFPAPPPLDEPLDYVSGRVPASLAQRLNAMTLALRERQPTRASQKGLPQQEILAVLLWAMGESDDPEAVDALAELHARYRAGRYAAAAEQLGSVHA